MKAYSGSSDSLIITLLGNGNIGKVDVCKPGLFARNIALHSLINTFVFFDNRTSSFSQLLPILEDGSSGEYRKRSLPYNDVNGLQTIRDDTSG